VLLQTDISLLLGIHGSLRPTRFTRDVFRYRSSLRHDRHRRVDPIGCCATREVPGDIVGVHQSGAHLSPSPQVSAAA